MPLKETPPSFSLFLQFNSIQFNSTEPGERHARADIPFMTAMAKKKKNNFKHMTRT